LDGGKHPSKCKWFQLVKFVNFCKYYACFDCVVINHQQVGDCNEHGTIYAISSDFGDRMTTQSMGLMLWLSEHFLDPWMK